MSMSAVGWYTDAIPNKYNMTLLSQEGIRNRTEPAEPNR